MLRQAQHRAEDDPGFALKLARACIVVAGGVWLAEAAGDAAGDLQ